MRRDDLLQALLDRLVARQAGQGIRLALRAAPVEHVLDAGQQLLVVVGLGQVVVRPALQPPDLVADLALGRDHDHGDLRGRELRPQMVADLESVHVRHHEVQQDQVGQFGTGHLHGLTTVGGGERLVSPLLQQEGEDPPDVWLVVDDEDAFFHGNPECAAQNGKIPPRGATASPARAGRARIPTAACPATPYTSGGCRVRTRRPRPGLPPGADVTAQSCFLARSEPAPRAKRRSERTPDRAGQDRARERPTYHDGERSTTTGQDGAEGSTTAGRSSPASQERTGPRAKARRSRGSGPRRNSRIRPAKATIAALSVQ